MGSDKEPGWLLRWGAFVVFLLLVALTTWSYIETDRSIPLGWHHAFDVMTSRSSPWSPPSRSNPQTGSAWDVTLASCGFLVIPTVTAAIVAWWYRRVQLLQSVVAAQQKTVQDQQERLKGQQEEVRNQVDLIVAAQEDPNFDVAPIVAAAKQRIDARAAKSNDDETSP